MDIKADLEKMEKLLSASPSDSKILAKCINLKKELELCSAHLAKGAQIRARMKFVEHGEKSTKYFFSLEKSRGRKKSISTLVTDKGEVLTDQMDILDYQVNYYRNLYSKKFDLKSREKQLHEILDQINVPELGEREKSICEGLLSVEEASDSLKRMRNNSSPGSDGLTAEFYKAFWGKIGPLVVDSLNEAFNTSLMSISQRRGIITLLHKDENLPREQLNNWRPITLTNVDYKILAKSLARHLQQVPL